MRVLIVGCGGIGSWHAFSLLNSAVEIVAKYKRLELILCDMSRSALDGCMSKMPKPFAQGAEIQLTTELPENGKFDFCIIATSSMPRSEILERISGSLDVKFFILEKVLFPHAEDYNKQYLKSISNAYVNCPRRYFPGYLELKQEIDPTTIEQILVEGSGWGLGSNAIHFIDIASNLLGEHRYEIDSTASRLSVVDSKRVGYKELVGEVSLTFANKRGTTVRISDSEKNPQDIEISIICSDRKYTIRESAQLRMVSSRPDGTQEDKKEFLTLYQSGLTNRVLNDLMTNSHCYLTPLAESIALHLPFIKLIEQIRESGGLTSSQRWSIT